MANYRRGAQGPEIERIQSRLKELGHYRGPIDGDFGGGTESAVKAFQRAAELGVDGIIGPNTWDRLFPQAAIPAPAILERPLTYRTVALTGAFETSAPVPECFAGLSGDFDGQGMSFGALQWNFGQGSLPPLFRQMDAQHRDLLQDTFHEHYPVLMAVLAATRDEQLAWARAIQDPRHRLVEPWFGLFKTLGRREEFQAIQLGAAGRLYEEALALCRTYGVWSERAVALMFDIKVQNGSISALVRAQIEQEFARLTPSDDRSADEVARLRIIATRRAEAAHPRWVEDVRARKLTIANGEGTVHGRHYRIDDQYGIGLKPAVL